MLEISIFCVILFAIAYWATLFIMGRREDVLHGELSSPSLSWLMRRCRHLLLCQSFR
jgi:hypothetical protein